MTKHDTWVKLKPENPYQSILNLFPDELIPMRDPFPMELSKDKKASLWIIDLERLDSSQINALVHLISIHCHAAPLEVAEKALKKGGFAMSHEWIESMECGDEGFQRQKELAIFFETAPQPPSSVAWGQFIAGQVERWIEGNEEPPPINSIEDVYPSLRTPELERALKMREIEFAMGQGNYSALDVLTGRAFVDSLNIIDPESSYSLVGYDEEFDDEDIYE